MAKVQKTYACQSCGAVYTRWNGKCDGCAEWNTIAEDVSTVSVPKGLSRKVKGRVIDFVSLQNAKACQYPRFKTGIQEFDRTLGGGLVPGSAILIGGDPGIGKSTLLLQAVCVLASGGGMPRSQSDLDVLLDAPEGGEENVAQQGLHCVQSNDGFRRSTGVNAGSTGLRCLYISGEESVDQVRMRAQRLGLDRSPIELASATNVRDILASLDGADVVVIDSIQTMYIDNIDSAPGTVTQVRSSAQEIIRHAKAKKIAVIFVGHVTKDGQIAGPRVLEHMVDTVLHFEGDRAHHFRILRGIKNRFGPTDEIGVFEMAGVGLIEVANPSALFLSQRSEEVAGSAVLAALEGTRPMLVEVQALVAPTSFASPRRSVIGWDPNRLAMISAVLETRLGLQFSGCDIFLNIAGGIRIAEPAADLAVAAALVSALQDRPLSPEMVFFGEIGLAGEVRAVAQAGLRLKEAAKLGFKNAMIPSFKNSKKCPDVKGISLEEIAHVQGLDGRN